MRRPRRRGRTSRSASPATARELLARTGRLLLWLAVVVVLARGLAAIASAQRPAPARPGLSGAQAAAVGWPDDAARAFAVQFTAAYLTHTADEDADGYVRRVEGYASAELVGQLAPMFDRAAPGVSVQAATVAGVVHLEGGGGR